MQHAFLLYRESVLFPVLCILINSRKTTREVRVSMSWVTRNTRWWENVLHKYTDARFKGLFRASRGTFLFIFGQIQHDLLQGTVCEEPISHEYRLVICLYHVMDIQCSMDTVG